MKSKLIENFDVECFSCETIITANTNDVYEIMNKSFECPVCKENLTGNVQEAMKQIHTCNQEYEKLKKLLVDNIIKLGDVNP